MDSVEKVKILCKEKGIALSKIEKDLGFANGYIGGLKKGVFPYNRLLAIADYLGVPAADIEGDEMKSGMRQSLNRVQMPKKVIRSRTDVFAGDGEFYYMDKKSAELCQQLLDNKDMRVLFDAARDVKPENIQLAAEMLKRMKETNPDG